MKTVHRGYNYCLWTAGLLLLYGCTANRQDTNNYLAGTMRGYYCTHAGREGFFCDSLTMRTTVGFGSKAVDSGEKVRVSAEWNEQGLYFLFTVTDTSLTSFQTTRDHRLLSRDDVVEVLIDPVAQSDACWRKDDRIYHFNLLGQVKDDQGSDSCKTQPAWNGAATAFVKLSGTLNDSTDRDQGYRAVVWIPWRDLDMQKPCAELKIDLAVGDNGFFEDWCGARPFRRPDKFRWVQLIH